MFVAGMLLNISACRKDQINLSDSNDPIFKLSGTFDGDDLTLVAGDNNAYMHTGLSVENGVNVFSGNLDDGTTAVQISIYDGLIDQPNHHPIENLPVQPTFARDSDNVLAHLSKSVFPNASLIDQIEWSIDGSVVAVDSFNIVEPGYYNVCAKIRFYDGTLTELCNDLIVGYSKSADAKMLHYLNQEGGLSVWLEANNQPINKVKWYLDGNEMTNDIMFNTSVDSLFHLVEVYIQFVNGAVRKKSMIVDGSLSGKFVTDFTSIESDIVSTNQDYNVLVRVFKDGKVYSSSNLDNSISKMEILDVDYYGLNEIGQTVYKVKAVVDAKVAEYYNGAEKDVEFETTFGIAFEE